MNPCVRCAKKGNCPEYCKPKADFIRHMKKLNRKIRAKNFLGIAKAMAEQQG